MSTKRFLQFHTDHVSVEEIFQVAEDGDTILVVGPDKVKIQVLSSFLKHISPVFRAMLDSSMSEGEAFRNRVDEWPIEITFPDDDSRAMLRILQCLYGADACSQPSAVELKQIAILANKYGMTERLKYFGAYWLRVPINDKDEVFLEDAWDTLVAAYLLKSDIAFFDTSKAIIRHPCKSLLKYAKNTHDRDLGLQLSCKFTANPSWLFSCTDEISVAIEEVRRVNRRDNRGIGVCLDCFIHSTDSFARRLEHCMASDKHSIYA